MSALATPLDDWLAAQQRPTAVDRFARWHDTGTHDAPRYRELLPTAAPRAGEQFAFEVDLAACTGCKACVTACHSLNGLDDDESWRRVRLLELPPSEPLEPALAHPVTSSCHHCVDPACMNGCPVNAYDKDPLTGIVRHLDDQCIGCRYCVLTCPYEVPRFNERLGIVRKCDLCADRLVEGEAPACVQACPNEAIRITVVRQADAATAAACGVFVAGTPDPALTAPTTRYVGPRAALLTGGDLLPAARPAETHPPLAVMLVLTQLAVGVALLDGVWRGLAAAGAGVQPLPGNVSTSVTLAAGVLALAASVLHLGRPMLAWRALIGLRHSWLSREILAFGLFAGCAAASALWSWRGSVLPGAIGPSWVAAALSAATVTTGLAGVACSVMIYAVTGRAWWQVRRSTVRFGSTMVLCGASTLTLCALLSAPSGAGARTVQILVLFCVVSGGGKLLWELAQQRAAASPQHELWPSVSLLRGPLHQVRRRQVWASMAGALCGPALLLRVSGTHHASAVVIAAASLLAVLAGELWDRQMFFAAAGPPRSAPSRATSQQLQAEAA